MGGSTSKEQKQRKDDDVGTRYSSPLPVKGEDYSKELAREKLPDDLQRLVDSEETLWDSVYDGRGSDSTDTSVRYAAYASRLRTILLSAHRYVAYTSDVGESFRPVAHPWLVKGAYGISWAYLIGDVSHEGYKAYVRQQHALNPHMAIPGVPAEHSSAAIAGGSTSGGLAGGGGGASGVTILGSGPGAEGAKLKVAPIDDWRTVVAQRAVFQSVASMGLPAFTIHSIVRYSGRAMKDVKNVRLRTWGPIGLGLAAVPFLPYVFDKPVEEAVEWTFHKAFETIGGPSAVERTATPAQRAAAALDSARQKASKVKEKEL